MNTPATTTTPASKLRSFLKPAADGATDDAATEGGGGDTGGDSAASAEQPSNSGKLLEIDYAAAEAYVSDGKFTGTIKTAKPTASGNGFHIGVIHGDNGSYAGLNFNLFTGVKDGLGRPEMDDAGKPKIKANVLQQKPWVDVCRVFGLEPKVLAEAIIAFAEQRTGEKPPIVGMTMMWDFKQRGAFLNCELDAEGSRQMLAEAAA